ncbi:hypothetical protein SLA2020_016940 [Shorea laevis]
MHYFEFLRLYKDQRDDSRNTSKQPIQAIRLVDCKAYVKKLKCQTSAAVETVSRLAATVSTIVEVVTTVLVLEAKTLAKVPDLTTSVVECGPSTQALLVLVPQVLAVLVLILMVAPL